jgi:hypothetical protein
LGGVRDGIAGTAIGLTGGLGTLGFIGNITRDLQLEQVRNRCPAGTSASAMRFTVPHAAQVASIIRQLS